MIRRYFWLVLPHHSNQQFYAWKRALIAFLVMLRLTLHEPEVQVIPCAHGISWLGFVVYPTKHRNVVKFSRLLRTRGAESCAGAIILAEFDASVQRWINYVHYADIWGLRKNMCWGNE